MGFFRSGLVLLLGILLFFSFLAMNSFFILGSSLKYENVHEGLYSMIKDISEGTNGVISEEVTGEFNLTDAAKDALATAKNYCKRQNATYYNFSYEGYAASIPCEKVVNATSPETFVNETYDDVVYDIYYREYDCGFWDCFSKTGLPFFLVSKKAMDYWMEKFYFTLLASLILIALIFLFIEQKINTPIIIGVLLVFSAFPLLKLKDLLYFLAGDFSVIINLFLNSTRSVFLFSLILGIFLAGAGISLRFWMPETIKKKFSVKEVNEIVKSEIVKEREKQMQQMKKKKREPKT